MIDPGLAPTPPMGFNTWNHFGLKIDENLLAETIVALREQGLAELGYVNVNIDDGWMAPERVTGRLQPDPQRFPGGIRRIADIAHAAGLRLGIYSDCGRRTCGGLPASYGYETEDARTFAEWEVDLLKYDWCHVPWEDFPGRSHAEVAQILYTRMAEAIAATGRPILLSMCNWGDGEPWRWARGLAHMWRTTDDIVDAYRREGAGWRGDLLSIFRCNVALAEYAGPGGWNDPDMLEIGNGGMTTVEYETQFSLWCLMAAPLLIGTDVRTMTEDTRRILTNRELIAVDQDRLGRQARLVQSENGVHLLVKPLDRGDLAVGLFNEGDASASFRMDWDGLAGRGSGALIRDLWTGEVRSACDQEEWSVLPHETKVWRLTLADR